MYSIRLQFTFLVTGSAISADSNKTTKMMGAIIGTYYGFFLPQIINQLITYDATVQAYVTLFLVAIFYCNALANPIIYAWMNPDFNFAYRKILHMKVAPPRGRIGGGIAVISGRRIVNTTKT